MSTRGIIAGEVVMETIETMEIIETIETMETIVGGMEEGILTGDITHTNIHMDIWILIHIILIFYIIHGIMFVIGFDRNHTL